jgi:molybdopterin-guanine dinucleotide biosynthesis protein A
MVLAEGYDGAVPRLQKGYEPLCAIYRARVLREVTEQIRAGNLRISDLFEKIHPAEADEDVVRDVDPLLRSFININRTDDLRMARVLAGAGGKFRAE